MDNLNWMLKNADEFIASFHLRQKDMTGQLHKIHAAVDANGVNTVSFCRAKPWKEMQPRGVSLAKIKELRSVLANYLDIDIVNACCTFCLTWPFITILQLHGCKITSMIEAPCWNGSLNAQVRMCPCVRI